MSAAQSASAILDNPELSRWFTDEVLPHETALRNWLRHRFPALREWDDLIQESYLRLWRARSHGPIHSPRSYLFTTARNLAINRLVEIQQKEGLREYDFSSVLEDDAGTPEKIARRHRRPARSASPISSSTRARIRFPASSIMTFTSATNSRMLGRTGGGISATPG